MAQAQIGTLTLSEQAIGGETFIGLSEDAWLVKSGSQKGMWYSLTLWNHRVSSCTCPGFQHRGECRHIKAFEQRDLADCERCGHVTRHRFFGRPICGICILERLNAD